MGEEKIKLNKTVIVEGKYDKIKLSAILDANIITTDGFSVFNNREKTALIRRLCEKAGVIILTDSDKAGFFIRNKLSGYFPKENVTHIYIPQIEGREKRKKNDSKERLLGVEGMEPEVLRQLFEKAGAVADDCGGKQKEITKAEFYAAGYSGKDDSRRRRELLAEYFGLPKGMTANALLSAINMLSEELPDMKNIL